MSICSNVQETQLSDATAAALAETFKALGDPTRVRMLDALSHAEVCVCDLAAMLRLTESAVSHQLRLLRSLRLVRSRRAGRHIYYALADQHVVKLFQQGLEHVEENNVLNGQRSTLDGRGTAEP
jgi:DNA-binding transcriptional ArsR family regulator